jgi:hypothetical protein
MDLQDDLIVSWVITHVGFPCRRLHGARARGYTINLQETDWLPCLIEEPTGEIQAAEGGASSDNRK